MGIGITEVLSVLSVTPQFPTRRLLESAVSGTAMPMRDSRSGIQDRHEVLYL
jgi:hypothetical protein